MIKNVEYRDIKVVRRIFKLNGLHDNVNQKKKRKKEKKKRKGSKHQHEKEITLNDFSFKVNSF